MIDKAWVIFLLSSPRHWTIAFPNTISYSRPCMLQIGFGLHERSSKKLYKLGTYFTDFVGNKRHVSVVIGGDSPCFTAVALMSLA